MRKFLKKLPLVILAISYVLFLPAIVRLLTPTSEKIEKRKELKVGEVGTRSPTRVNVHVMIGDVFNPSKTKADIGFDVVPVSCFFDPIGVTDRTILLQTNPLLYSALKHSARKEEELNYFAENIVEALANSSGAVAVFLLEEPYDAERVGDKIEPYVWKSYKGSMIESEGIKYLVTLPLFDPLVLMKEYDPREARERLAANLEVAVRRMLSYREKEPGKESYNEMLSVGFAILGGTSHRGGDSPCFLNYRESCFTILKAIETGHPPGRLSRVYFVAYEDLEGVFKKEAIRSLEMLGEYLLLKKLLSQPVAELLGVVSFILLLSISLMAYPGITQGWRGNWPKFIGVVFGPVVVGNGLIVASTCGLFHLLPPEQYNQAITLYVVLSLILLIGILIFNRKIKPTGPTSATRGS